MTESRTNTNTNGTYYDQSMEIGLQRWASTFYWRIAFGLRRWAE